MTTSSQALALVGGDDDRTTVFDNEAPQADIVYLDDVRDPVGALLGEDDVEFMEDQPTAFWGEGKVIDIREQLRAAKADARKQKRKSEPPETAIVVAPPRRARSNGGPSGWRWVKRLAMLCLFLATFAAGWVAYNELTAQRVQLPAADATQTTSGARHIPLWSERPVDRGMYELDGLLGDG